MKKLSLKGFDFKALFLNHAEKMGFGLGVLITLFALVGTDWARYGKSPEEIISKVTKARTEVQNSTWPADKVASFALQDFMEQTHQVRGPLALSKFEFSTPLWHPMYRKQELRKEPELLAVQDLDVKYGQFTLGILPRPTGTELLADGTSATGISADGTPLGTPLPPVDQNDEFAPRRPGTGLAIGEAFGAEGTEGAYAGSNPYAPPGAATLSPYAVSEGAYDLSSEDGMDMGMGYGLPTMESRGERFIAVRGVWPVRQQLEKLQKALNLGSLDEARMYLRLTNFVLERQTAVAGSDPWSGPWDEVGMTRVEEILNETFDYDFDPIDPRVTDAVITMPLPARLVGYWGDYATHPKVKNFELSGPEREREMKLQEKLQEEWDKLRLQEESRNRPKGGFAKHTRNLRAMAETIYSSEETSDMFEADMTDWMRTDTTMQRMNPKDLEARLKSAVDRLLLFRFFDFEIQPGHAYRYRVKLVLENPNYEQPADQVIHPDVAQGIDRETPWSKESNVAVVPESVNYFLKAVPRDPVNEQKHPGKKPVATFSFFEWDAGVGTMIADQVSVWTFGQFIGEDKKKSLRLNVAKPSLKDEEVTFRSDDLFLDGEGDVKVAIEEHKDLKLPSKNKGQVGIVAAAVLVDRSGELVLLDPTKGAPREKQLSLRVEQERAGFKHLENQPEQPVGGMLDGMEPGMEGMMYDEEGNMINPKMLKKKRKSRKPTNTTMMGSGMGP